ncbi:prolyl oligopeptidase family serine peptidase [Sinorhizobium medicae]|uniref:Dipeptidyl aminopeptidase BI n=2 Tax=Sinorhizobium medicae TaxID=110321 RepID=A0A508X6S8_9HYPH|nr:S9 family peptidase [Sinorhizobium medicae]ABR59455.1 Oligopeptidase B [Sinorhizobium medicae WSM419]MBO1939511.1 S9 family peptidase [Sinorhizobium medicae]MBO1963260.1 S9 family peptidase [Sinorhizobium medicae]MDX0423417.1 prolyl oligopeptidase family serine peptidase [Sinorhizobium medicae]MDX0428880.1 prolyl oligopeptidase family serine peptidase [Sinorhizobium medicae]
MSVFKNLPAAPAAPKKPVADTRHGVTRTDDYAWLRADNWQAMFRDPSILDPAIRQHLEAENTYMNAAMADTKDLQKTLFAEMRGRIKEDDSSVPMKDGAFAYGTSYVTGGEHPRYFRIPREGAPGDESIRQLLLDGDKEAEGKAYFRIAGLDHSSDHSRGIWGYDDKGSEYFTLRVRDLSTGEELGDRIENTGGGGAWAPDGTSFFYTVLDENHRPSKIFHHIVGTPQSEDRLVYEEPDAGFFMSVGGSLLDDFIYIDIHDHETSEYRLIPTTDLAAEPKIVAERVTGLEYSMTEGGDVFYVLTNADGAKDFKIMEAPVAAPQKENWREVVAHKPGTLILSHMAYARHLVWLQRRNGLPEIVIRDRRTGEEHAITFAEEAYSLGLSGAAEYDTDVIRFSYSSMTTPSQLFDYNMQTRERTLLKTQEVPSGHEPDDYVTRRVFAPAPDGEQVPVTLLYRKDTPLDGSAPCLLYGYGAYGITIPASFNTNCLSLVDRGFIYAIAHIRGGKDKGFHWYEDGKMAKKTNTFNDFIAAADYLNQERFTSYANIVAEGGSAGGMLMGAIANMAPEKFRGIIAAVPFVDVLNTMLDDSLPLTPPEWPEWGNPIESREFYGIIAAYSPYDNVDTKSYPAMLALGGLTDPRVTYWEPAKWVAKLREKTTGSEPILLKTNMDAGHGGASGRFQRLEEIAFEYAFAIKVAGRM